MTEQGKPEYPCVVAAVHGECKLCDHSTPCSVAGCDQPYRGLGDVHAAVGGGYADSNFIPQHAAKP